MTFSHKTVNILFHIRKFLSDKDALNTLCGSESCLLSKKIILLNILKQNTDIFYETLYIHIWSNEVYTTDINTEHLLLRNKNGVKYGVLYTRL